MSFQGVDMVGLADLLRQSEGKPDSDSDDETHGTVGGNRNFGEKFTYEKATINFALM